MLRGNTLPIVLATVCGVLTAVSVLQPELEKEKIEKEGEITFPRPTAQQQNDADTAISRAIKDDIKQAAEQLRTGGFAWGLRKAIWPEKQDEQKAEKPKDEVK